MTNNNNNHDKDDDDNNVHAMPSSKKKKKNFIPILQTGSSHNLTQEARATCHKQQF